MKYRTYDFTVGSYPSMHCTLKPQKHTHCILLFCEADSPKRYVQNIQTHYIIYMWSPVWTIS